MKQDPIDFANEVISQGMNHPALARLTQELGEVCDGVSLAKFSYDRAKATGMADTENHNFVNQHIVQRILELSRVAANVAKNMEEKLKP